MKIFMLLFFISGCAVFPKSHTVFEPISSEGTLIDPKPCGYMFTNNVLLVIDNPNYTFETMAYADEPEKDLRIFFRIVPASTAVQVDFNYICIKIEGSDGNEMKPKKVTRHEYGTSIDDIETVTGPEILEKETDFFYFIEFPVSQNSVEGFELIFHSEAITNGDTPLVINSVKFKKTKKTDIYFGSINC